LAVSCEPSMSWPSLPCSDFPTKVPPTDSRRDEELDALAFLLKFHPLIAEGLGNLTRYSPLRISAWFCKKKTNMYELSLRDMNNRRQVHRLPARWTHMFVSMSWPSLPCFDFPTKIPPMDSRRDEELDALAFLLKFHPLIAEGMRNLTLYSPLRISAWFCKKNQICMLGLLSMNWSFLCVTWIIGGKYTDYRPVELTCSYKPVNCNYRRIYPRRPIAAEGQDLREGHLSLS
jgi:hypothetical protein